MSFSSCIFTSDYKYDEFEQQLKTKYHAESVRILKVTKDFLGEEERFLEVALVNPSRLERIEEMNIEVFELELEKIKTEAMVQANYQTLLAEVDEIRIEVTKDMWLFKFSEVYAFPLDL